jgi:tRNA modification GTPase
MTVLVLDRSTALPSNLGELLGVGGAPPLVVVNKIDLPSGWARDAIHRPGIEVVETSVLTGAGLDELRRRLIAVLTGREELRDPPAISNVRHLALVDDARCALERSERALGAGATEELVLAELAAARRALEEITGRRTPDDLLEHIFATFCVGK